MENKGPYAFKRKWIYNPHIHGDEESYNLKVEQLINNVPPYNKQEVKEKIMAQNQSKVENGEEIQLVPFKINDYVDPTGRKTNLDANPLLHHYKILN